jgi:hypothetical protein
LPKQIAPLTRPGELESVRDLTAVVVADTPAIASAVIDSLPIEISFFLVGPKKIAFLRRSKGCRQYFTNDLSLEEANQADFIQTIGSLDSTCANVFLVLPVDDSANRIIHSTFDRLGVRSYPMPDRASFEILNDKWRFHQLCSKLGIPVPKAAPINNKADIDFDYLRMTVGLPFVLKPTNKCDRLGVHVIFSKDQLHKEICANANYNFAPLVAQTFVTGVDIDISVLADNGHIKHFAVQIRKERTLYFVKNEELVSFAEILVRHLCYTGLIHIDARLQYGSGEIFLVEANPRFWGSLDAATCCGLNFVRAGIDVSMGRYCTEPTTISDVSMPSIRRILAEIATCRRSYLQMPPQLRLRVKHAIRDWILAWLHPMKSADLHPRG